MRGVEHVLAAKKFVTHAPTGIDRSRVDDKVDAARVLLRIEHDGAVRPTEVPALLGKPDMADRELGVSELGLDAVDHGRRGGRSRKAERQPSRGAGCECLTIPYTPRSGW
jgi:hypothetical protein